MVTSRGQRLKDAFLKPAPTPGTAGSSSGAKGRVPTKADPYPEISSADLQHRIKWLDDRERLFTLMAAPLGAVFGIVGMIVAIDNNPPLHHKGHASFDTLLIYGVVAVAFAISTLIAGIMRRRSFAIFSLLFMGYDSVTTGIYALPIFWALAGWMFYRSYKAQRALTERGDHPRQQRGRAAAAKRAGSAGGSARPGSGRTTTARGSGAGPAPARRKRKATQPTGPAPNRRYTPPKPKDDA